MKKEHGVSLVELLLVVSLIGFLALIIGSLPNSINLIGKARKVSVAREIAAKEVEDLREVGSINLANGQSDISDPRFAQLPQSSGTSLVEDCDPLVCTNGEIAKQVTVSVKWVEEGKEKEVKLITLISEGGLK